MPPTTVLVFGNPKGGTPLMLAHPELALDLPFRVLISQQADGRIALEIARILGKPYRQGFVKNRYVGRTFIMPGQQLRRKSVRRK
ncbi:DUF302 domain-containing protein, partial [Salmonella enterica subsp. enterica serovar Montevideo]|nr:DUF302 domain-containing protein [Salmonella enterica subsp. enterica serovar Montevideo]